MEGKHKNYSRAGCENKNPSINLAKEPSGVGRERRAVPRPQLTLERIYLLKYEIYIPLNKLFSQTATGRATGELWESRSVAEC